MRTIDGPWFDDLELGQTFIGSAYTLTSGRAAAHQMIVGDRLPMMLDEVRAVRVAGRPIAHPNFVTDVAIGQSTVVTQHVRANLFYRHLVLLRQPAIGDTLHTTTEIVGLKQNRLRPDRAPTGLAALRIRTHDQEDREVLDFYRCAMLPVRDGVDTGHADDMDAIGADREVPDPLGAVREWDLSDWPTAGPAPQPGEEIEVIGGDVVSNAPELARLTQNVARVHHEAETAGGRRLVYGGHTIGIAAAHLARAVPDTVTILGWDGCDHIGPVHEGDVLHSRIGITAVDRALTDASLVRATVRVDSGGASVLDWRVILLVAAPT